MKCAPTSGRVSWYRATRGPFGERSDAHGPCGISRRRTGDHPRGSSSSSVPCRSVTRKTVIGRSPSRWSANRTSGPSSARSTAPTLVPSDSIANAIVPPRPSKLERSAATSELGVYRKSRRWNGGDGIASLRSRVRETLTLRLGPRRVELAGQSLESLPTPRLGDQLEHLLVGCGGELDREADQVRAPPELTEGGGSSATHARISGSGTKTFTELPSAGAV